MRQPPFFYLLVILVCFFLCNISSASTPEPPATPPAYVVDLAGLLSQGKAGELNGYLKELEQKTTAQIMVLTVQSLDGENIADFSLKVAEKWKPGQKGKDNGVLLTVARQDRKYRIEVGYGLESILPDSFVGSVGREHLVPNFRQGNYTEGIFKAVVAMAQVISTNAGVEISGMPKVETRTTVRQAPAKKGPNILTIALVAIVLILALVLFIKDPSLFSYIIFNVLFNIILGSIFGRRDGGGWSGGGGFGGGGGGSFGGGGASGDW